MHTLDAQRGTYAIYINIYIGDFLVFVIYSHRIAHEAAPRQSKSWPSQADLVMTWKPSSVTSGPHRWWAPIMPKERLGSDHLVHSAFSQHDSSVGDERFGPFESKVLSCEAVSESGTVNVRLECFWTHGARGDQPALSVWVGWPNVFEFVFCGLPLDRLKRKVRESRERLFINLDELDLQRESAQLSKKSRRHYRFLVSQRLAGRRDSETGLRAHLRYVTGHIRHIYSRDFQVFMRYIQQNRIRSSAEAVQVMTKSC